MMQLRNLIKKTKEDESGAVTVDWVVLTAGLAVVGATVVSTISPSLTAGASSISSQIMDVDPN